MAEKTYTVTVASGTLYISGGTGNVFYLNSARDMALEWVEGATLRFNQSDSSNDNHPLIFTTSNSTSTATMRGGIISSGVTYYLDGSSNQSDYTNTSTFNAATTRYVEIAPASETDFYYACWVHGIGMGGAIDVTQDTWGAGNWSANLWGVDEAFNVGWGAQAWNDGEWGTLANVTLTPTGVSSTSSVGSPTITTEINTGWGQDGWGVENWGQSGLTVVLVSGVSMTSSVGSLAPADVMGLTGLSATASIGAPTAISDVTLTPTGQSATSATGSVNISFDIIVNPTGLSATSSVGTIDPADQVMGLTGLGLTSSIGTISISGGSLVNLTGLSMTSSTGNLTPADVMGLTGVSATASTGNLIPADVMGLTGVSATASVGNVAPLGYEAITGTQSAGYSSVTATQSANYTAVNADN